MAESKQDLLHVVVVEPEKAPYKKALQVGLKPMQEIVGGSIQALYPFAEPIYTLSNGPICVDREFNLRNT